MAVVAAFFLLTGQAEGQRLRTVAPHTDFAASDGVRYILFGDRLMYPATRVRAIDDRTGRTAPVTPPSGCSVLVGARTASFGRVLAACGPPDAGRYRPQTLLSLRTGRASPLPLTIRVDGADVPVDWHQLGRHWVLGLGSTSGRRARRYNVLRSLRTGALRVRRLRLSGATRDGRAPLDLDDRRLPQCSIGRRFDPQPSFGRSLAGGWRLRGPGIRLQRCDAPADTPIDRRGLGGFLQPPLLTWFNGRRLRLRNIRTGEATSWPLASDALLHEEDPSVGHTRRLVFALEPIEDGCAASLCFVEDWRLRVARIPRRLR